MIPFAPLEWDASRLNQTASDVIVNVIPAKDGYWPFPSLQPYSEALPAPCKGGICVRKADGSYVVVAFTAEYAYLLETDGSWTEIGGPYTLATTDLWSVKIFGNRIIATQINDDVQYFDLGVSAAFAPLPNVPGRWRYVVIMGDYVGLLSTTDFPNRAQRSGANNSEWWTPKQRGSDYQDLPDGGWITGAVGHDRGMVVFSENSIRLFEDQPGSQLLFTLQKAEYSRGAVAPHSIVQIGRRVFYLAEDGFFEFSPEGSVPIGSERVDRTFLTEKIDLDSIELVQGAADPVNKLAMWLYTNTSGERAFIGYHVPSNQWLSAITRATFLLPYATPGLHLDTAETDDDPLDIDSGDAPDFDSRAYKGGRPIFGAFDTENKLGSFAGPNMEATLETADMQIGGEGMRGYLNGFTVVGVSGAYGRALTKETLDEQATATEGAEAAQNRIGMVPVRASGRTVRMRVRIPYGTVWRKVLGVVPNNVRTAGRQ